MPSTPCTGAHSSADAAAALAQPPAGIVDCDVADDSSALTAPEAAAAQADQEARAAAESVRATTLQRLQDLKGRLEQVCWVFAVMSFAGVSVSSHVSQLSWQWLTLQLYLPQ